VDEPGLEWWAALERVRELVAKATGVAR